MYRQKKPRIEYVVEHLSYSTSYKWSVKNV